MSLLDALLEDGLYDPPIVAQDVYLAIRSDSAPGAGTAENPYRANSASEFDALMNDPSKAPANTTIHLGPGTFYTAGFNYDPAAPGMHSGWSPQSGQRIIGAGINATTLQLTGVPSGKIAHAIGMDLSATSTPPFLQGFELSDLTIDANVICSGNTGSVCGGGLSITGKDIYIRRVRVKNYGGRISGTAFSVLLAGKARSVYSYDVQNCVIEDCILQTPGDFANDASAKLLCFEGEIVSNIAYAAKFCVIRSCDVDGVDLAKPITAISPGVTLGTIIEENQVYNCQTGLDLTNAAAQDLAIWDNYFHNVRTGMSFSNTAPDQVKRVVLLSNTIGLETATPPNPAISKGIVVAGSSNNYSFLQFVARKNMIRDVTFPSGNTAGMVGISLANIQEAIVEDNLINNCDPTVALSYNPANVQYLKTFNNQSTAGVLMRAYNTSTHLYLQELADAAEDVLLPI